MVAHKLKIPVCWPEFGFTGTQQRLTNPQSKSLVVVFDELFRRGSRVLHHGDCRGADDTAHFIWTQLQGDIHLHPPTDPSKRANCQGASRLYAPQPYLERNMEIATRSAFLVACPKGMTEERRSGTWATVRYARNQNKHIIFIFPSGDIVEETVVG